MHPDEKANLEAELVKATNVLELQPDNKYFKKRQTELKKKLDLD